MVTAAIVDCTKKDDVGELVSAVERFCEVVVVRHSDVARLRQVLQRADCVVVSGSAARIVDTEERERYLPAARTVLASGLPVLGVCFGHQLLSFALGAGVASLKNFVRKFELVRVLRYDELFDGFDIESKVPLAESHHDYVVRETLSKARLVLLADSESCEVEAVRLASKPVYGVQFHPERTQVGGEVHEEGLRVIENFIKLIVKR